MLVSFFCLEKADLKEDKNKKYESEREFHQTLCILLLFFKMGVLLTEFG